MAIDPATIEKPASAPKEAAEVEAPREQPETVAQPTPETAPQTEPEAESAARETAKPTPEAAAQEVAEKTDPLVEEVEGVLATETIREVYEDLDADAQARFKQAGEQTAQEIVKMMRGDKVDNDKILKLVKSWISSIPGAKNAFVLHEAKNTAELVLEYIEGQKAEIEAEIL